MDNNPKGFYNDKVVMQFAIATVLWGVVGMLVGVIIAAQLYWPAMTDGISWLQYGRLRPLHTNAVIFAFGGSALFATSLWCVQRTSHVRLISDKLAAFVFWGWQLIIVAAAITLPLGMTPVSYTHLDVYKRQCRWCSAACLRSCPRAWCCIRSPTAASASCSSGTC